MKREQLLRTDREGEWLGADQTSGGGTSGPISRPQTPIPFPLLYSREHYNCHEERLELTTARASVG
jgi:hypothetical protein